MSEATDRMDAAHLAALFDANIDADEDERMGCEDTPLCRAIGPQGDECVRSAGHYDVTVWPRLDIHVGYSTDHYQQWPVGWMSTAQRIQRVLAPEFAANLVGSPDYVRGARAVLDLVRSCLT